MDVFFFQQIAARFGIFIWTVVAFASGGFAVEPMTRLPPGVRFQRDFAAESYSVQNSPEWNRILLTAKPIFHSGDVDSLSSSIRESVGKFLLTIGASVQKDEADAESPRFILKDVAVGYSVATRDGLISISAATADRLDVSLGFFQRQILLENERQLAKIVVIKRTSTLLIFDTPAIMVRNNAHVELWMRHFIWVDAASGDIEMMVWTLSGDVRADKLPSDNSVRWVQKSVQEDRAIHVDGDQFRFGIPNDKAFGLVDMPPGKDIAWTVQAKRLCGLASYSQDDLAQLTQALNEMLKNSLLAPAN